MRDEHVKDAAQDVAEDVMQDVAENVLGAAENGSSSVSGGKIIITPVACPTAPHPRAPRGFSISGFFIVSASGGNIITIPVACLTAPPPKGFFINGFFIVAPSAF